MDTVATQVLEQPFLAWNCKSFPHIALAQFLPASPLFFGDRYVTCLYVGAVAHCCHSRGRFQACNCRCRVDDVN
jgi:hypothetical protein